MALDDLSSDGAVASDAGRVRWIGIYIAAVAVLLAICSVVGGNIAKDAAKANIDASNMWAFFQAKNARQTQYELARDQLEVLVKTTPGLSADARASIDAKINAYKARIARYQSEPERQEGLTELMARAKAFERERDDLLARDPYFDFAQAFLQIAIVLASVAIVTGGTTALLLSGVASALGVLLMVNGYVLAVDVIGRATSMLAGASIG